MTDTTQAFGSFGQHDGTKGSWFSSFAASTLIYGGIVALALMYAGAKSVIQQPEKPPELTFVEKVAKPPPPPPPPPNIEPKVEPVKPAAKAAVVPKNMKVRKLDKPPPPKELVAPKEMPTAPAKEVDPSLDKGVAVVGEPGEGDPAGLEGGLAKGGTVGGIVGGAIALPEDAVPPMPASSNVKPEYPREARATGKQGMVVLKVVILANGDVAKVEVLRGDEPFASAAIAAVKTWHYEPARHKGQPITVYRIIQIPFRLTA
jgi:periplasmic protein TonB